ncbi:hypothetical protein SO802_013227 [Lithocarpus litseifolius]|uniref:Uncharacterized protein n=1 Tax=Lithocarpus litseifolius TaxID=425828 RepID=A0AAW2D5R8_9ROSI
MHVLHKPKLKSYFLHLSYAVGPGAGFINRWRMRKLWVILGHGSDQSLSGLKINEKLVSNNGTLPTDIENGNNDVASLIEDTVKSLSPLFQQLAVEQCIESNAIES